MIEAIVLQTCDILQSKRAQRIVYMKKKKLPWIRRPFSIFSVSTLSTVDGGDFGDVVVDVIEGVPSFAGDVAGERLARSFGLDIPKGLEDFEGLDVLEGLEANTGLGDSAGLVAFTGLETDLEF